MPVKQNKELMARFVEEANAAKGDIGKVQAVTNKYQDPGFVYHVAEGDLTLEQSNEFAAALFTAFPDFENTIEDMVGEGDKLVTRGTWRGTHKGEWLGVAPTGKGVRAKYMSVTRMARGKMVEVWQLADDLDLLIQLGAIPNPYVRR